MWTIQRVGAPGELAAALRIREQVFVREQGIPAELDRDGLDAEATHVLVLAGENAVATGRVLVRDGGAVAGRIAVLPAYRGHGLGRRVVAALEQAAREQGATRIRLHPHEHLERFYGGLGYRTVHGRSMVGRHSLLIMEKAL